MNLMPKFLTRRAPPDGGRRESVLIVGGTRGLGLDLARTYAARGAQVALCARDPEEVERVRQELADAGHDVFAAVCDATVASQMYEFVSATREHFGHIDVLLTCAATIQVGPMEMMARSDFEEALQQIFWSTYHATMAVLPAMRALRRGRIVHITSFGGKLAVPHLLPYCAAKFATTGFSAGLRAEVAKDGVSVTTVTPGLLRTGAHVNAPFKGQYEKEYAWFTAGLVLPLVSLSSESAARRIVRAADARAAECTLSLGVRAVVIANALFPGMMAKLLALQDRLLPSSSGGGVEPVRGSEVAAFTTSPWVQALEELGRENAISHNAYPAPAPVQMMAWVDPNERYRWS